MQCSTIRTFYRAAVYGYIVKECESTQLAALDFPSNVPVMIGTVPTESAGLYPDDTAINAEVDSFLDTSYPKPVSRAIVYQYVDWTRNTKSGYRFNYDNISAQIYDRIKLSDDIAFYSPTASLAAAISSKPGAQVFVYDFENDDSYHSVELNYQFGVVFTGGAADWMQKGLNPNNTDVDKKKTRIMIKLWTNFAKYGNPTDFDYAYESLNVTWTQYDATYANYLQMSSSANVGLDLKMSYGYMAAQNQLWNVLVPRMTSDIIKHN